jgi:ankyrin repeat protein
MARFMKRPVGGPRNVLQEAFEAFDKDGSGKIDRAELRAAMTKLAPAGTTVDETTLTVLMVHVDTNGDGLLDFTEFVQLAYMLKSGGVDVTSIGDDGGGGGAAAGGGGGINPSSSWIRLKCGGREMYMNGDTELMSLKAPADGVKAEARLADEEQFAFMFATAEQCDAGSLNPASDWQKINLGDRAVFRRRVDDRLSLIAPAEGVKLDVPMPASNEEEFVAMFEMAQQLDATLGAPSAAPPDLRIYQATSTGNSALVGKLIAEGADVNAINGGGFTALHGAAEDGLTPIAEQLLRAKADPSIKSITGDTALDFARREGHRAIVGLLTGQGGQAAAPVDGRQALLETLMFGAPQSQAGRDLVMPAQVARPSMTDLHRAAQQGNEAEATSLLAAGAGVDINARNAKGWTPLHFAAYNSKTAVAKLLLAAGADVTLETDVDPNVFPFEGKTASMLATAEGCQDIVDAISSSVGGLGAVPSASAPRPPPR